MDAGRAWGLEGLTLRGLKIFVNEMRAGLN